MNASMGIALSEPKWRNVDSLGRKCLPESLAAWLRYDKSLTQRIRCQCEGHFSVQVVGQLWQRPLLSERRVLGLRDRERCLIRQVKLLCDHRPWVFARTIIPVSSLTGACRQLQYLGKRPLGEMLFNDTRAHFCLRQAARLQSSQSLFTAATQGLSVVPDQIWGRRSVYRFAGSNLLVNEVFLPDLFRENKRALTSAGDDERMQAHAC